MKQFFLIKIFSIILLLCLSTMVSAQVGWTKELEEALYSQIYNSVNLNFQNDSSRKQFSICVVQKLKSRLPDGLASISKDSLNKLVNKIGGECKKELNTIVLTKWSPDFEKAFRKNLHDMLKKTLPENEKKLITECLLSQYKKIYPEGMPGEVPIDVENKVLGVCYVEIMRMNKNTN